MTKALSGKLLSKKSRETNSYPLGIKQFSLAQLPSGNSRCLENYKMHQNANYMIYLRLSGKPCPHLQTHGLVSKYSWMIHLKSLARLAKTRFPQSKPSPRQLAARAIHVPRAFSGRLSCAASTAPCSRCKSIDWREILKISQKYGKCDAKSLGKFGLLMETFPWSREFHFEFWFWKVFWKNKKNLICLLLLRPEITPAIPESRAKFG